MVYVQYTEFWNNAKKYLERLGIVKGYIITKRGKPLAKIIPFHEHEQGWKREVKRFKLRSGTDSSVYLNQERNEE